MRKMFASALVFFAILALAVPASAQYIPTSPDGWWYKIQRNQMMMLEADNLALVNQVQRQGYRSLGPDLRWNGSAYGIPIGQGFYPMYDRNRQPLSGRQRIERGAGIVVATDGVRRIINNPRGAAGWIEAAVGVVLTNDSKYRGQPKNQNQRDKGVVVTPPSQGQGVRTASDGTPVAVGSRPNQQEPVSNPPSSEGEWRISNRTGKRAEVWDLVRDPKRAIAVVAPWGHTSVSLPQDPGGYKAVLIYSDPQSGRMVQENAQIRGNDNFNGWDILAPAVQ